MGEPDLPPAAACKRRCSLSPACLPVHSPKLDDAQVAAGNVRSVCPEGWPHGAMWMAVCVFLSALQLMLSGAHLPYDVFVFEGRLSKPQVREVLRPACRPPTTMSAPAVAGTQGLSLGQGQALVREQRPVQVQGKRQGQGRD